VTGLSDKSFSLPAGDITMPSHAARAAYEQYSIQPATLVSYKSEGTLLILADASQLEEFLLELPKNLLCFALLPDGCPSALVQSLSDRRIAYLDQVSDISIDGYLGAFYVTAKYQGMEISTNQKLGAPNTGFDLILNIIRGVKTLSSIPPIGCFVPDLNQHDVAANIAQLPDWVGEFEKPKYFELNRDICAHTASAIQGCNNCITACATGAIQSLGREIQIDPHLCQGCGDCATVCPSGALRFAYPCPEDTLNRLRQMLIAYASAGGKVPVILFHDDVQGRKWLAENASSLPINILAYEVEGLGTIGMEIWLAALAYGAAGVLILATEETTQQALQILQTQLECANVILSGINKINVTLKLVNSLQDIVNNTRIRSRGAGKSTAKFAGNDDKRGVIRLAVDYLIEMNNPIQPSKSLPAHAPFGEIVVDTKRCTLCMSCVSVCPERALTDGPNEPKLGFIEADCVQCGICETACPENAISLNARYLYDSNTARKKRLLHEEIPFCCVECGRPFATQKMIKVISEKLSAHPMFQGEDSRRLMMCEECRVKDQFSQSGAANVRSKT